jgi:hypothetical protein
VTRETITQIDALIVTDTNRLRALDRKLRKTAVDRRAITELRARLSVHREHLALRAAFDKLAVLMRSPMAVIEEARGRG